MNLFLLTAAHDQHVGFNLAVMYVRRMVDMLPLKVGVTWIVADDGNVPVYPNPEVSDMLNGIEFVHLRREFADGVRPDGLRSFQGNMRELAVAAGQMMKRGDLAAVIEDDWMHPHMLRDAVGWLSEKPERGLWGETQTRYYRIDNRRYHVFKPNGRSALSGTVFRATEFMELIAWWSQQSDATIMLDNLMWKSPRYPVDKLLLPESRYVVGIKGLPGAQGLGMGCRLGERHRYDPDGKILREWIGEDANLYEAYRCKP